MGNKQVKTLMEMKESGEKQVLRGVNLCEQIKTHFLQYNIILMIESDIFNRIVTLLKQNQQLIALIKFVDYLSLQYLNFASEAFLNSMDKTQLVRQMQLLNVQGLDQLISSIQIPTEIIVLTLSKAQNYSLFFALVPNNLQFDWHSHPQMFGVSKCLYGLLQISTLNKQVLHEYKPRRYMYAQSELKVQLVQTENQMSTAIIVPKTENIHKIKALKTSGFLQLLMPDYPQDQCDFYELRGQKNQNLWFKSIDEPKQIIKSWQSYLDQITHAEEQVVKCYNET